MDTKEKSFHIHEQQVPYDLCLFATYVTPSHLDGQLGDLSWGVGGRLTWNISLYSQSANT